MTDLIYTNTTKITQYKLCPNIPDVDLSKEGSYKFGSSFRVEVFDCVEDHLGLLKQVFDFGSIKQLFARKDFTFCYDSMNGVQGPYAKRIFVQEFGAPASALINCDPKEDFGGELSPHRGLTCCHYAALLTLGRCPAARRRRLLRPPKAVPFTLVFPGLFGLASCSPQSQCLLLMCPLPTIPGPDSASHGHADPNLTHAVELVAKMGLNKMGLPIETKSEPPTFGAAADGDADRNMIMGSRFFVSPSDSLAMIVANATCIPYFASGLKGCARSMPTSCALDLVALKLNIPYFEVPTGWKFFGNLMDSGTAAFPSTPLYTPFICGEESFGTGGDHVREKDGMFAVLAWLQILAAANLDESKPLVSVSDIAKRHWAEYGRNYYARYDYEGVDKEGAEKMMAGMVEAQPGLIGASVDGMKIAKADMFAYTDPIDGSVSKNQGVRFIFESGSRIVFRLSGTGVAGATVRMYLEAYEPPTGDLAKNPFDVVKPLADIALKVSKLAEFTGRTEPTVIT